MTSPPNQPRCDAAGMGTCAMSFRMLGSRPAGGMSSSGTNNVVSSASRHEEGATVGDVPSPPPRLGNSSRKPEREGDVCGPEGRVTRGLGDGAVKEGIGWKGKAVAGGIPSTWRADTPGLRVNTGASGVHVSDWSLQSCDEADDGAVSQRATFLGLMHIDTWVVLLYGASSSCVIDPARENEILPLNRNGHVRRKRRLSPSSSTAQDIAEPSLCGEYGFVPAP